MKSTGIVRKVDELGRIVLPIELRRTMGIDVKDALEIYVEGDTIMLRKYEPSCVFCGNAKDIVNFKGNSELTTENDHQQALSKAISDITALIKSCFGDAAQQFTFVCIPASTQANTVRRFEQFSQQVCENTGMTNAYPLLTWNEEGEEYTLPTDALQGKDVLLFDDIIASGGSVCRFAEKLTTMGANVIAALALGKKL